MIKPVIAANAVTTITVIAYILCALFVFVLPDISFTITQSWFHFLNVGSVHAVATNISITSTILGVVTLGAVVWLSVFCSVLLYNKWVK